MPYIHIHEGRPIKAGTYKVLIDWMMPDEDHPNHPETFSEYKVDFDGLDWDFASYRQGIIYWWCCMTEIETNIKYKTK